MPTPNTDKREFSFRIVYYTRAGSYWGSAPYEYAPARVDGGTPYMQDVASHIRGLRDSGGQGRLPGLDDLYESWDGHILIVSVPTKDRMGTSILIPAIQQGNG